MTSLQGSAQQGMPQLGPSVQLDRACPSGGFMSSVGIKPPRTQGGGRAEQGEGLEYIAPSAGTACKLCWDASGRKALYKY